MTSSEASQNRQKIRTMIVDDHPLFVKGLRECLARSERVEVVGEFSNGTQVVRALQAGGADVVLLDLKIPGMDGIETTTRIRESGCEAKILIVTGSDAPHLVVRAVKSGANGFVLKNAPPQTILEAIEAVFANQSYFSPEAKEALVSDYVAKSGQLTSDFALDALTGREKDVLKLLVAGYQNKEVASDLGVSVRTVETHRENLYRKLKTNSIAGLTKFAISVGLVELD